MDEIRIGIKEIKRFFVVFHARYWMSLIINIIELILLVYIWGKLEGIPAEYFVVTVATSSFLVDARILHFIDDEIREGSISKYLLYPIELKDVYISRMYFRRIIYIGHMLIILIFGVLVFDINPLLVLMVIPAAFLSLLVSVMVYSLFIPLAIKTETSWGFAWTFEITIKRILGGIFIPLKILYQYVPILRYLPFKWFGGGVYELIVNFNPLSIILAFFWSIFFYAILSLLMKRVIRSIMIYGG